MGFQRSLLNQSQLFNDNRYLIKNDSATSIQIVEGPITFNDSVIFNKDLTINGNLLLDDDSFIGIDSQPELLQLSLGILKLNGDLQINDDRYLGIDSDLDLIQLKVNNCIINGNLGVGGITPTERLDINGGIRLRADGGLGGGPIELSDRVGNNWLAIQYNAYFDGSNWKYRNSDYPAVLGYTFDGNLSYFTGALGTAGNNIASWSQKFIILANGDVGIGASLPTHKLVVGGDIGFSGTQAFVSGAFLRQADAGTRMIHTGSDDLIISNNDNTLDLITILNNGNLTTVGNITIPNSGEIGPLVNSNLLTLTSALLTVEGSIKINDGAQIGIVSDPDIMVLTDELLTLNAALIINATNTIGIETDTNILTLSNNLLSVSGSCLMSGTLTVNGGNISGNTDDQTNLGTAGRVFNTAYLANIDYPTTFIFSENGTPRMTLLTGGNVGIGVTPEAWHASLSALQVGGLGSLFANSTAVASNGLYLSNNMYHDGVWKRIINDETSTYLQTNGIHTWYSDAAGTADVGFTGTMRMTLALNGDLAITNGARIGTTTDTDLLQLLTDSFIINANTTIVTTSSANLTIDGANNNNYAYLNLGDGSTYGWQVGKDVNAGGISSANAFYIYDIIAATTRFMIDTSGNVGIGVSPSYKLDVRGTARIGGATHFTEFSADGDLIFNGSNSGLQCAQIYEEDGSSTLDLAAQDTYYQITAFSVNGQSNGAVPDHTNNHITIIKTGKYLIMASMGVSSAQKNEYDFHVQKNNGATDFTAISIHRTTSVANAVGAGSASGILSLTANDTIEFWVKRLDGAGVLKTIKIVNASITLIQTAG